MSEMTGHESFERVDQGLSRAASCCRELGEATTIKAWGNLSTQLLLLRKKAKAMYEGAALTEFQIQALVTEMEIAQKLARGLNG